jgi:hypothetical protein
MLWLLAPSLALALLGAHFYRAGSLLPVLACVLLIVLLAWPRAWVARLVQASVLLGAGEWLWTLVLLAQARAALGQPWLRLALILAGVAAFSAASALVFRRARLRQHYRLA